MPTYTFLQVVCCNLAQHADLPDPLAVWNRTSAKAESLAATSNKFVAAESLTAAISRADIICLCLSDDKAVSDVIDVAVDENVAGKLFVDMSTVHPDTSDAQSLRLKDCGATYLACPSKLLMLLLAVYTLVDMRQYLAALPWPSTGRLRSSWLGQQTELPSLLHSQMECEYSAH